MNRETKFRGYSLLHDKWLYGSLVNNLWLTRDKKSVYEIIDNSFNYDCYQDFDNNDIGVESESVGEYTGLKDKNGKEIYEGDIITFSTRRYHLGRDKGLQTIKFKSIVTWEDGGFMISEKQENDTFICTHDKDDAHESLYEVIGNIYEKEKP